MNFCPGELILELLARIDEWHQNLSEKTALVKILPCPKLRLWAVIIAPEELLINNKNFSVRIRLHWQ